MICPYCGKEMTLGYIQCRDGLYWNTKKRLVAALPSLSGIRLNQNECAQAWRCRDCKKIILEEPEA